MKELVIKVYDHNGEPLCIIHIEGATIEQKLSYITRVSQHDVVGWVTLEGSMK